MADETRIQVLKEPERKPETDSFMWLFRSGEDGLPPIVLYYYNETRARYNAVDFLDGFSDGYLETDGYQGYNNLPGIRRCSCWRIQEDTSLIRFRRESSTIRFLHGKVSLAIKRANVMKNM